MKFVRICMALLVGWGLSSCTIGECNDCTVTGTATVEAPVDIGAPCLVVNLTEDAGALFCREPDAGK